MPSGTTLTLNRKNVKPAQAQLEEQADCLLVIHKGVHEESLLDAFLPLRSFSLKVTVGVIGYDHAV